MGDCVNFMNLEAIRETVRKYDETWGAPGELPTEVTFEQMVDNCSICDFGIEKISKITETVLAAAGDVTAQLQQEVRRMTGEPLKRKCYKPKLEARVFNRDSYGIWDNVKGDWVKGTFCSAITRRRDNQYDVYYHNRILTRDTLPSINRLLERLRVESR